MNQDSRQLAYDEQTGSQLSLTAIALIEGVLSVMGILRQLAAVSAESETIEGLPGLGLVRY
jgi:hypothetical protein